MRYIDTSESYENGNAEKTLGEVLERTKMRKDVYLVTKNSRGKVGGSRAFPTFEKRLEASLERLRTDYIDCYYLHGVEGREIGLLRDPDVKAAFEKLKKSGQDQVLRALLPRWPAARNRHGRRRERLDRSDHDPVQLSDHDHRRCQKSSRRGSEGQPGHRRNEDPGRCRPFPGGCAPSPKFKEFVDKGFKEQKAAIKTVFADHRVHAVVSEMTNRDMLRENIEATRDHSLTLHEQKQLEDYRQATAHLYCHGCGHHCEPAANGVAVSDILRYLRYHEVYGKRQRAAELYQALPAEARNIVGTDLTAAQAACPHGLPVVEFLHRADRQMG